MNDLYQYRGIQRGVSPPYGERFSKETLNKSASSKAFAATTDSAPGCRRDELYFGRTLNTFDCGLLHPAQEGVHRPVLRISCCVQRQH